MVPLVVFIPNITTNHAITYTNHLVTAADFESETGVHLDLGFFFLWTY